MSYGDFAYPECENCMYNFYDEDSGETYCTVILDEDDMARMTGKNTKCCPFYRGGDEYMIVRKQI